MANRELTELAEADADQDTSSPEIAEAEQGSNTSERPTRRRPPRNKRDRGLALLSGIVRNDDLKSNFEGSDAKQAEKNDDRSAPVDQVAKVADKPVENVEAPAPDVQSPQPSPSTTAPTVESDPVKDSAPVETVAPETPSAEAATIVSPEPEELPVPQPVPVNVVPLAYKPVQTVTVREDDGLITETDLTTSDGGGVFDQYVSNLPMISFPQGVSYGDLLPMSSKSFGLSLQSKDSKVTKVQSAWLSTMATSLSRTIRASRSGGPAFVRSASQSVLQRLIVEWFIANAPADCLTGVANEQQIRAKLGLAPLPELEIYEYEISQSDAKYGGLRRTITDTNYKPEVTGVFDSWPTNFTHKYPQGFTYRDLGELHFTSAFDSGLERVQFSVTASQEVLLNQLKNHMKVELNKNRASVDVAHDRKPSWSALFRSMVDYFYSTAPQEALISVSGEQEARARLGMQPLPELDLFIHERSKLPF